MYTKRASFTIGLVIMLIIGMSLLLYPSLSNYWNSRVQSKALAGYLDEIEEAFPIFLKYAMRDNPMKGEFLLPTFVGQLIDDKKIQLKVLSSPDTWFGVTYAADKPKVVAALQALTAEGRYPDGLWK